MDIQITNETSEQLNWQLTAQPEASWITSMNPGSGSLNSDETISVSIAISREGLAAGDYSAQLNLEAGGENYLVPVFMRVPDYPILSVNPASLDFESDETTLSFQVSNEGGSMLSWNAASSAEWISSILPSNGSIGGAEMETLTVSINRDGLEGGEYTDSIRVTSNGGAQTVSVRMVVIEPPLLTVHPVEILFESEDISKTFIVSNSGGSMLNWYASENPDQAWIESVFPYSGVLGKNDSVVVTINVKRNELDEGTYFGDILVTSNGGQQNVEVEMVVPADPPVISLMPTQLDFDSTKDSLTFEIKNLGGDTLNWEIQDDELQPWIYSITPQQGITEKESTTIVTVQVNRLGMLLGEYSGNIFVNSNDRNVNVVVRMIINQLQLYERRINCGSRESYVDVAGNQWEADQPYSENDWGYVGGYANSTLADIDGTVDDALFQYERNDITEYKFDVMDGEYDIYLFFSEIYFNSAGYRVFDIEIEDETVLSDFDVFAEVGRHYALGKKFTADTNDGQLNIRFVKSGEEPSISAILIRTGGVITDMELDEQGQIIHTEVPQEFRLHQNYPNPFKFNTTISLELPFRADLKITIYNALGQQVQSHVHPGMSPGIQAFSIDATGNDGKLLPSGVYFYQIEALNTSEAVPNMLLTRKMIVKK
ncbi:T9SS type A sorting domain-containing protein [candidate division KSB1 bacterium]|nr:T9SS type A sorting domain-containing protein [candidate division KSB1 bacterium]